MITAPEKRQSNLNSCFASIKESWNHIILELERVAEIDPVKQGEGEGDWSLTLGESKQRPKHGRTVWNK